MREVSSVVSFYFLPTSLDSSTGMYLNRKKERKKWPQGLRWKCPARASSEGRDASGRVRRANSQGGKLEKRAPHFQMTPRVEPVTAIQTTETAEGTRVRKSAKCNLASKKPEKHQTTHGTS